MVKFVNFYYEIVTKIFISAIFKFFAFYDITSTFKKGIIMQILSFSGSKYKEPAKTAKKPNLTTSPPPPEIKINLALER